MHLGPPPLVVPVRRPEDLWGRSEDESSCDVSGGDVTSEGGDCKVIIHLSEVRVICMVNQFKYMSLCLNEAP